MVPTPPKQKRKRNERPESSLRTSAESSELVAALAGAQGEIDAATRDRGSPHSHSRYADLAGVWRACRKPLSKRGLAVVQIVTERALITRLVHRSGQWMEGEMRIALDSSSGRASMQAFGSGLTLSAMVGVAPDDDDGNETLAMRVGGRR